jgi:hypothetical protein
MNIARKTKFVPIAKHALDIASIRQTQAAVNALLNNKMVVGSGTEGEIHNSDGNTIFELPAPPNVDMIFPFKIYAEKNLSATADQIKQFTDLNVDINNYTLQIRSGVVAGRTYINNPTQAVHVSLFSDNPMYGNFEQQIYCPNTDSNGSNLIRNVTTNDYFYYPLTVNKNGPCRIIDSVQDTLLYGVPEATPSADITKTGQVCINPIIDGFDQFQNNTASFWIEIIDSPVIGYRANLMARMFGTSGTVPGRQTTAFPLGGNIVPIGIWQLSANVNVTGYLPFITASEQIQAVNLVNRFPQGFNTYRGIWSDLYLALPAGKTNLAFYPGDIVEDTTHSIGTIGSSNVYPIYVMTGPVPIFVNVGDNPRSDPANWAQCGIDAI